MNGNWTELYDLIHSMNPSEKGYFRKFVSGYGEATDKVYDFLFTLLDKQSTLNEDIVVTTMQSKCKNLHTVRNHLYTQILKSLSSYYSKKHLTFEFREHLNHIEILQNRGLYGQADKFIQAGLEKCDTTDSYMYQLLFVQQLKQNLQHQKETLKPAMRKMISDKIMQSATFILNRQQALDGYHQSVEWLNTAYPLYDEGIRTAANQLLQVLTDITVTSDFGYSETNLLYAAIANICRLTNKLDQAIFYQLKTIALIESLDLVKMNRESSYCAALYNLGSMYFEHNHFKELEQLIHKMEQLQFQNKSTVLLNISVVYVLRIHLDTGLKQFNQITNYVSEAIEFFYKNNAVPNLNFDFQIRLLGYYIYTRQLDKALDHVNFILSNDYTHSQPSFHIHVRLMQLIIHYELKNNILLPSLYRSTYRFMNRYRHTYKTESTILNFLRRTLNSRDKQDTGKVLNNLLQVLQTNSNQLQEQGFFRSYFDYIGWLRGNADDAD